MKSEKEIMNQLKDPESLALNADYIEGVKTALLWVLEQSNEAPLVDEDDQK